MKRFNVPLLALWLVALCLFNSSCMFFSVRPERMDRPAKSAYVWSASRVHLSDGSVIYFPRGFRVHKGVVKGQEEGVRYDFLRTRVGRVKSVPLDSVAFFQVYREKFQGRRSLPGLLLAPMIVFISLVYLMATTEHTTGTR